MEMGLIRGYKIFPKDQNDVWKNHGSTKDFGFSGPFSCGAVNSTSCYSIYPKS